MAEMIGIRLQLSGANETASGLRQVSGALEDTAAEAGRTATALQHLPRAAAANVDSARATSAQVQTAMSASSREMQAQANMLKQANRQLSMQMTDVVTSLVSGMPPHMVLIQQGGQIKDAYGGVGEAIKGVGGYLKGLINPLTVSAGAIAALGVAAFQGAREMDAFEKALVLTGNAIGMTSGELSVMARRLDESTGATTGRASDALAMLAGTAGITRDSIQRIAEASINMERAGGPSVEELAKKFAALGQRPLEALVKLSEAENFLTESVRAQVSALIEQGREAEAAALAQATYSDVVDQRAAQLESRLGYLELSWRKVGDWAKKSWDAMLGIGRKDSDEQRLEELQKDLDERLRNQASARSDNRARYQPGIDALRLQIKLIEDSLRKEREQQELRQRDLDRAKARAAWDQERIKFLSQEQRLEEEIARIRKQGAEAGVSPRDIEARVRAARERLGPRTRSTTSGQKVSSLTELGDLQALRDVVAELEDGLDILADVNDERARGVAVLELEQAGLEGNAAAIKTYGDKLRDTLDNREWQRTVDQVGQSLADALMTGGRSAGEALKRYFSSLILQPIIQAIVNPMARAIVGGLGLAGAAGSAAAGTAGSAAAGMGLLASGTSIFGAGAAATMGGNLMGAMGSAGAMLSGGATLQGLAMGAGTLAGMVAPAMIGQMIGRSISGGYSAMGGSSGSTAVNAGTVVGALIGGPIGAGIGAAIGGLVNRAFGRRLEDTGIQGTFGGEAGFTGQQFSFERGGWFRSDRTRTGALGADTQDLLSTSFSRLRDDTTKMARDLGLASASVATFSRDVKISLKGLTQEQIAERLQKELGLVADEMARLVGGADATADSLRTLYQAVMQERAQLEQRLLQLQGDTAELRRRERDALHESNRALYDRIISLQDERAAMDAMVGSAVSAVQQQISASQAAANAARAAAQAYAAAGTSLRQTIAALLGGSAPGASAATAYRTGLTAAQGGDAAAMGNLGNLATAYAESLRGTARTRAEANIGSARIAAELSSVAALSDTLGTQRSVQAGLLDINTAALQVLQEDLQNGNLTVELLREHSTNLQAIATALSANGVVVGQLQSNDQTTGAVASSTDGVIEEQTRAASILANSDLTLTRVLARLSEADPSSLLLIDRITSGNTLLADRLSGVINAINGQTLAQQAEVKRQQDLLKAQADLESAAGYLANLQSTARAAQATFADTSQTEQVRVGNKGWYRGGGGIYETRANPAYNIALAEVARANEALAAFEPTITSLRDLVTSLGGVPAFALGGLHTGGMRLVGERGPELEVTGPARYWSAADTTAMLGNATRREEVLAAEIRALRAELQGLRAEARVTAVAANKSQRLWERVTRDGESMQITDVTPTP
jgi:hypothetical protein